LGMKVEASFVRVADGHAGVLVKIGTSLLLLVMYNDRHSAVSAYLLDQSQKTLSSLRSAVNCGTSLRGVFDVVEPAIKCQFTKVNNGNWKPFKI